MVAAEAHGRPSVLLHLALKTSSWGGAPQEKEVPLKGLRAGVVAGSSFSFHMPGITPKAKLGADKCFPGYLERFISHELLLSADSNIYIPFMWS